MIFSVDFDGTVVQNKYPYVGETIEEAVLVLKELVKRKHKIILNTNRTMDKTPITKNGKTTLTAPLEDAIQWFKKHDIELYGINENPQQKLWTNSNKIYADYYIDDRNLGIDVLYKDNKPYINWRTLCHCLVGHGILSYSSYREIFTNNK